MTGVKLTSKLQFLRAVRADPGLSMPAKCVMSALVLDFHNNKSGQCNPSLTKLAKGVGRTRRAILPVIQELRHSGWVEVTSGGPPHNANRYHFDFSRRREEHFPTVGKQTVECREEHFPQTSLEPLSPLPAGDNGGRDVGPSGGARLEAAPPVNEEESRFRDFWRQYPKRQGEDGARREFGKAVAAGADPKDIIAGALRFAAERIGQPERFTPSAANWLRDGRWKDPPSAPQPKGTSHDRGRPRRRTAAEVAAEIYQAAKREGR